MKHTVLVALFVCAALYITLVVASIFIRPNPLYSKADAAFTRELKEYLVTPGDAVAAEVVNPKNWEQVCVVPPYVDASAVARDTLKVNSEDLVFIESQDGSVQDDMWGLVFLSNPNNVEYRKISVKDFSNLETEVCRARYVATFSVTGSPLSTDLYINLR